MKVLVTGVTGQLGFDVVRCLKSRGITCLGVSSKDFDITEEEKTAQFLRSYQPDAVIHCSAFTAVDAAEEQENQCTLVNVQGTRNIAKVCRELNCKMVYLSTDYVFSGDEEGDYEIDSATAPESVYGKTKLAGEKEVENLVKKYFIVRISWVYGINGKNFIKTMLRIGKDNESVRVVSDQVGSPTYTRDLALLLCDMIESEKYGIYHATNEGFCSWAEFAEKIFELAGYHTIVERITSEEYHAKAPRPKNSRMSKRSLDQNGFHRLPSWEDALKRYLEELTH